MPPKGLELFVLPLNGGVFLFRSTARGPVEVSDLVKPRASTMDQLLRSSYQAAPRWHNGGTEHSIWKDHLKIRFAPAGMDENL